MAKGRTPDFELKAMSKGTERAHRVGAAWMNQDKEGNITSISINLDEFVVLSGKDNDLALTLFPWEDRK